MKLELKNVKIHNDMSEETSCFSATLYVDGKKAAHVKNNGRGGCNSYYWDDPKLGQRVEEWAKTQPCEFEFERLDQLVDKLLNEYEVMQQLTSKTKKATWFRLKGDKKGEWRTVKAPFTPDVERFLVQKYGDKLLIIANKDLKAAVAHC